MSGILVTGATSYLGGKLVERLVARDAPVHVVVRPGSDTTTLNALATPPAVHVHDGSAETLSAIFAAAEPDAVCHLASLYRRNHDIADVDPMIGSVVAFGTQVLEAMVRNGTPRIVTLGSYFQFFDGDEPRAVNLYAAAKNAFDVILDYFVDAHDMEAARLILFEVYGEDDPRAKLMSVVRDAALNGDSVPLPMRDSPVNLVHVDDVADAIIHALDNRVVGGPFAVGSGEDTTLDSVVSAFEAETGRKIARNWGAFALPDRHPETCWDGPSLPGWRARISLREGVRRMLGRGDTP